MKALYLNEWSESGKEGMIRDFEIDSSALDGCQVLLASYTYKDYSGTAFVLLSKEGKLYEVNGSHCSCYGLEGQWSLEETSLEAIEHRLKKGNLGRNWDEDEFGYDLILLVQKLKAQQLEVINYDI